MLGLVATVVLAFIAVSLRGRDRCQAGWIVAFLVLGWAGWTGGNAIATAGGPAVQYLGTAQVLRGPTALGAIQIQCSSLVGDPTQLAGFGTAVNGFEVHLRTEVDRSWQPADGHVGGFGVKAWTAPRSSTTTPRPLVKSAAIPRAMPIPGHDALIVSRVQSGAPDPTRASTVSSCHGAMTARATVSSNPALTRR